MERSWSIGPAAWLWPDDVDETGCDTRMADRYLPIEHTGYGGSGWQVAKVFVDEDDKEMLADAHLISAAPDLLASLKAIVEASQFEGEVAWLEKLWPQVNAALDKAEGTDGQDRSMD